MARQRTDLVTLWRAIEQAGNIDAYIDQQLRERGFLVERKATEGMSKRELAQYKKQLKEEAAEKRRLRKEAWQAYKASHIVHLGEGVYWNDLDDWDKWDLEHAEERAAENQIPAFDNPKQLAEALGISVAELRWFAYHREAATNIHYRRFFIPKSDGSQRPIWEPLPKLKAAQRWILSEILEKLPIHGAAHGFLAGRSIATNAGHHTDAKIVLKMDLRNFFPPSLGHACGGFSGKPAIDSRLRRCSRCSAQKLRARSSNMMAPGTMFLLDRVAYRKGLRRVPL